jgi:homopolymeric O-antigen transport system permease protein
MARLAMPAGWAGALTRQRGPLRTYQWLWLLLCMLGALVVAAPRILSQPLIYTATATVTFDTARYGGLYRDGQPTPDYLAIQDIAINLLRFRQDGEAPRYPGLGSPTLGVRYNPQPGGSIAVFAVGRSPAEAQQLADDAAEALARSIRAAGGREIFRVLSGGYLVNALLHGNAAPTPFEEQLRTLFLTSSFLLNKPTDPDARQIRVEQLAPEDVSNLARAFEVRDVEIVGVDLPAIRERIRQAQLDCRAALRRDKDRAPSECLDEQRLTTGLDAIRRALDLLNTPFAPDIRSEAYRSARAVLPAAPIDRHIPTLLALGALVGLALGGVSVAVDRTAGVMPKLRELWGYRELIRNLVLRDLMVRYKGSALGYLWTQFAPLLLMLVFWFVFSFFFQSAGAMFPVFLIVGLLPWNFCNEAVAGGTRSVLDNANLIKKVFFPREVLPLVSVFSSLLNFVLSLPMLFLLMAVVQLLYPPLGGRLNFSWTFAYLPVLLVIQTIFLAGVVLFTSTLAVFFRDFVHLIGILLQFWFFLTPVVYTLDNIKVQVGGVALATVIRWLNPMASLIDFYRGILYGNVVGPGQVPTPGLPALDSVLRVLITALLVLAVGYWFFQRRSGRFGEEI